MDIKNSRQETVDRGQGKSSREYGVRSRQKPVRSTQWVVSRKIKNSAYCLLPTAYCLAYCLLLTICGCSYFVDRMLSTTSPRRSERELEHNEKLYTATADKIGTVDSARQIDAMMELCRMFQGLPDVEGKLKARVVLKAMSSISDSIEEQKLDFYRSMLGEAFSSGEPSKFLAVMQMMQMHAFKRELDERLPAMLEAGEKALNWPPLAAAGGGIFATLLGVGIYFVRLLHRSTPVEKGKV